MIASHLLQEGVEVVRNIRDSDWHKELPFGTTIADGSWRVQWDSETLIPLSDNPFLRLDPSTGLYSYGNGDETFFRRKVEIATPSGEGNIRRVVTVTIEWKEQKSNKTIKVEEHLYNWK